jgi:transcriptional regulator GlxA family with amidase domain
MKRGPSNWLNDFVNCCQVVAGGAMDRDSIAALLGALEDASRHASVAEVTIVKCLVARLIAENELGNGRTQQQPGGGALRSNDIDELTDVVARVGRFTTSLSTLTTRNSEMSPVAKALRIIADDYSNHALTLRSLAASVSISYCHLSRLFKRDTGRTFKEHITAIRANAAARMLAATSMSIKAIALEVGYKEPAQFNRCFKSVLGMSPSQLRQNQRCGRRDVA